MDFVRQKVIGYPHYPHGFPQIPKKNVDNRDGMFTSSRKWARTNGDEMSYLEPKREKTDVSEFEMCRNCRQNSPAGVMFQRSGKYKGQIGRLGKGGGGRGGRWSTL